MATLGVGAQLDFVDGEEITAHAFGHRLDRANPVLRARRHDAFFARDQRHDRGPAQFDNPVIHLARKQAQRQADDTGAMCEHPLDCIGGFTCVGRAQNGHNTPSS